MPELQVALRYVVFGAFAASLLVALASWLVRTRRISPFGALGRTFRTASDPLIRPIETRLVRAGGNPVHAGWWLVVAVAAAGVLLITLWNWLVDTAFTEAAAYSAGPRAATAFAIDVVYRIVVVAQLGAQTHAYTHLASAPDSTQHRAHAVPCSECSTFAPL